MVLHWLCDSPRTGCAWRITLFLCMWREQAIIEWSLLLLAATVWSSAHMPLRISDRNKMVPWPGCEGRVEFSLHTKNVQPGRFIVKRRWCCCILAGGVALIVWFTLNRMCVKNNTIMYVSRTSNNSVISWSLLLRAATVWSSAHMPLGISDRNSANKQKLRWCPMKHWLS